VRCGVALTRRKKMVDKKKENKKKNDKKKNAIITKEK
jgi:hypothetical protein